MNLIITCARHLEPEASEEITKILEDFGDSEPKITITNMSGILTVKTQLEPVEVVKKIKEMILDEPWSIRYCLRIIPMQKFVDTDIEKIDETVSEISNSITEDDTYRISIEKRNSQMVSQELIKKIAEKFKNKVSLENPDKIIQIEILGGKTGVSILSKGEILSLEKTKRSLSD
ncbi:MAG: RNA methyltransferase [Nitrosopumilaceae archaeon]|uniref:RNA methyltransferase n=3 Tax=Candidatus Nitrosomaritimum aestuariumsis TaxID=3342354 RepID=A0AC60VY49_9ARCH|nr:RNA methyltransferase [Nitrosopumilaceae archaeon]MBA4459610.1 RNA methyltransferase [Nitrosopumilaceae archaeon]MBA4461418.1 RNA methyltransferase [Nitrosopumilaceae archaeon]MBA4463320.1 RNA methyltransferase [Nitrosopumilaceae archaeon]NCF21504.1 RNA methyltransferase [Nitrosopumilaceae archaeon]